MNRRLQVCEIKCIRVEISLTGATPDSDFYWESIQQVAKEISIKLDPALVIRIDARPRGQ